MRFGLPRSQTRGGFTDLTASSAEEQIASVHCSFLFPPCCGSRVQRQSLCTGSQRLLSLALLGPCWSSAWAVRGVAVFCLEKAGGTRGFHRGCLQGQVLTQAAAEEL